MLKEPKNEVIISHETNLLVIVASTKQPPLNIDQTIQRSCRPLFRSGRDLPEMATDRFQAFWIDIDSMIDTLIVHSKALSTFLPLSEGAEVRFSRWMEILGGEHPASLLDEDSMVIAGIGELASKCIQATLSTSNSGSGCNKCAENTNSESNF